MKRIIIFLAVYCVTAQACNSDSGKKNADDKLTNYTDTKLINKQRCSFRLPDELALQKIDTAMFSREGYIKIAPADEDAGMMQIFVYDEQSDVNEQIQLQEKALNSPAIFTATTITPVKHWGKYTGQGILMDGTYNGGIIKGKITVFGYSNSKSSFLIIRQDVGSHESVKGDFDKIENSFVLK